MSDETSFPRLHARTRRFTLGVPRNVTVTPDGTTVLFCRSDGEDPVTSLYALDLATGTERVLLDPRTVELDAGDLPPAERARRERARESATGVVGYATDRAARHIATTLDGVLVTIDRADGSVRVHDTDGPVFDPRPAPGGDRVASVRGNDLVVTELDGGRTSVVAASGAETESWGRAEFVAAEEMGRGRGHWWWGDDRLVVARVDVTDVDEWHIADPAKPQQPAVTHRYPAAGTTNATVELHTIGLDGRRTPLDWRHDTEADEYLARVVVDGDRVRVVRQDRSQRLTEFATLGDDDRFHTDRTLRDEHWIELDGLGPESIDLGDGPVEATVEDLGDRRALCLDGTAVTDTDVVVRRVVGAHDGRVVVTASRRPTAIELAAVDPTDGAVEWWTSGGVAAASLVGDRLVVNQRRLDEPGAVVTVTDLSDPDVVHTLDTRAVTAPLRAGTELTDVDGQPVAVFFPSDDDGTSTLPVLLDPYGGPHAQRVLEAHDAHLVSQWFADQGFVVIVSDGRGTPGRGPAHERTVFGDLAQPVLDDQVAALDHVAALHPGRLDLDRVGIRGWSFGGYLAALAVLRRPDRFHAAVAGAPVTTWRLYDTHYTERYLGHPDTDAANYDRSDLLLEADRLTRPLLLVHGLADDNVVAAHTLRLSSELLAAGRPHQVLPLSGVTHMTPQDVVAENLLHLQRDFLTTHLRPDGR